MQQPHVDSCLSRVVAVDSTVGDEFSYPCSVQPLNPLLESKSCYLLTYASIAGFSMVLDA